MDRGSLSEPENRLGVLNEPPCAEPHAGWCGGWRLDTSGYPIMAHSRTQYKTSAPRGVSTPAKNKNTAALNTRYLINDILELFTI